MTETHRLFLALLSISLYLLWVAVLLFKQRKASNLDVSEHATLVVYASQTGTAEKVARAKAAALADMETTSVVSMSDLKLDMLSHVSKAIFVVSTYGEGEPPDAGRKFSSILKKAYSQSVLPLSHLSFEVVGLGDRQYTSFCAFAVSLFDGLNQLGGKAASPLMTLDSSKGEHLSLLDNLPSKNTETSLVLTVNKRTCLNTVNQTLASGGRGLYALSLGIQKAQTATSWVDDSLWEAGDILEVHIPASQQNTNAEDNVGRETATRSYTIASVTSEGDIKLVVRQVVKEDGTLGLGSGLLTHSSKLADSISGTIRKNESVYISDTQCPLILIAAGSGIAGVRAQLAKRASLQNAGPVWVFYGERHAEFDDVLDITLSPFHQAACLHKKSTIFSRDENGGYVQHLLQQYSKQVNAFIGSEGHVYVCGDFAGMGKGVDEILKSILGDGRYEKLHEQGRYHRDLY